MLHPILLKLNRPDPSNRVLLATADVLYRIFGVKSVLSNHGKIVHPYRLSAMSIKKKSFRALITRLVRLLTCKNGKPWKNARNDIAFVLCLFTTHIRMAKKHLLDCGMMTASIINQGILGKQETDFDFHLESSQEDMELLQYFIYLLKYVVETGKAETIIDQYNIVSALLTLLLGSSSSSQVHLKRGTDLEKVAWNTLHAIAKHCPASLINQHGANTLLEFVQAYGDNGQGDSYLLCMCLNAIRTLLAVVTPSEHCITRISREVKVYFVERDGMAIFLGVLGKLMLQEELDVNEKVTVSNALLCCSLMGMDDPQQKKVFFSLDGVSTLISIMGRLLYFEKSHMDSVYHTAISECICGCITYSPDCLEAFLNNEGIIKLFDLMELSEKPSATSHLLSCLLQLCDYPRCMSQLLCWSRTLNPKMDCSIDSDDVFGTGFASMSGAMDDPENNTNNTFASLICALWKREETRLMVLRDPDGCIASLSNPLMSLSSIKHKGTIHSGVIRSMLDLLQPNSVCHKLFLLVRSIVELTKTEVTLFDGLSVMNQIIMMTILNYDGLKTSEVYIELIDEMFQQGFSYCPDELSKLVTISRNIVSTVVELQRFLLGRDKEKEVSNELEFYSLIKHCQLQDHLMAASDIDFQARTSDYKYLVQRRLWQKCELDNSVHDLSEAFIKTSRVHRTSDGHLNTTAWTTSKHVVSEPPANLDFSSSDYKNNDNQIDKENADVMSEHTQTSHATAPTFNQSSISSVVSSATANEGNNNSPAGQLEGGFYQVSQYLLQEAMEQLESYYSKHHWLKACIDHDEENGWKVRLKWKQDWYPLKE